MSVERRDLIAQLLYSALEREPGKRTSFLDEACIGDEALRQEVHSLLQSHEQAGSFLETSPVDVAPELLAMERAEAMVGRRVGPFQIETLVGSGGMGEVFRATDTRLGRTVAVKILPAHLSRNPELRQRLEREAQAISRLSHPNICTFYDIGRHEDLDYLVMEYIEGKTLEERLTRGALPLDEALRCGIEIAGALQAAHRQGITHRDIKPSNIMLVKGGCKVLDFGLAKLVPTAASLSFPMTKNATAKGTILGTIPYMSPEQLEGQATDTRSDIFALGAVLYEMITGRRAFEGKSQASLIAAIMTSNPAPIAALQPMAPRTLDHLVRRCLARDPEERWQTALDVQKELQWIAEGAAQEASGHEGRSRTTGRRRWIWAVGSGLMGAAASALFLRRENVDNEPEAIPFGIDLPDGVALADTPEFGGPAVAPDGSGVVFAGLRDGEVKLYFRSMKSTTPVPLPGTEGAHNPFWSHDSRRLGFFAGGELRTVSKDGGSPQTMCTVETQSQGGTWNQDGDIVYALGDRAPLYRISEKDKTPRPATTLEAGGGGHRWPCFLPDGKHFLYLQWSRQRNSGGMYIGSLDSATEPARLLPELQNHDSSVVYAAEHLLYVRNGDLMARPFDASTLQWTGAEFLLAPHVAVEHVTLRALFSVSSNGPLVYYGQDVSRVVKYDHHGTALGTIGQELRYFHIRVSPDGRRAAYSLRSDAYRPDPESRKLWVLDLETKQPETYNNDQNVGMVELPVFTPDGNDAFFWARNTGIHKTSFRTGKTAPVIRPGFIPLDISRDGRYLLLKARRFPTNLYYVELLPGKDEYEPREFVKADHNEKHARFSPDGHWVVYTSNESLRDHVYVRRFVDGEYRTIISGEEGGSHPAWIQNGDKLAIVYLSGTRHLMSVAMDKAGPALKRRAVPAEMFKPPESSLPNGSGDDYRWWDITPDGRFVYVIVNDPIPVTGVAHWTAMLKH